MNNVMLDLETIMRTHQTFKARLNLQLRWKGHTTIDNTPTLKQLRNIDREIKRQSLLDGIESFPYGRARLYNRG